MSQMSQMSISTTESEATPNNPCDCCGREFNEMYYAGCCSDGLCPNQREFLCTTCGTYDEELQCILCADCLKNKKIEK